MTLDVIHARTTIIAVSLKRQASDVTKETGRSREPDLMILSISGSPVTNVIRKKGAAAMCEQLAADRMMIFPNAEIPRGNQRFSAEQRGPARPIAFN